MGIPEKIIEPYSPYIAFTTTTTTTTQPPNIEYFLLPDNVQCPYDPCDCGKLLVLAGKKFNNSGSYIKINEQIFSLVHNTDALVQNEQRLITTSVKLASNETLNTSNIEVFFGNNNVEDIPPIEIIVKIRETQKVIGQSIFGFFDTNSVYIPLIDSFNLTNLTLQLEIKSLCDTSVVKCCDKLPSNVSVDIIVDTINCTTTTTLPPFCSNFNLPDSFYVTVVGYGALSGQQRLSLVTRSGNTWITSGSFPCGAFFYLSMTCDSNLQAFRYDGSIDCCFEQTKTVIQPTQTPLFTPNAVLPLIISYTDCACPTCTTTTTTTTTDFPTTPPPPPPVPCEESSSLTIQGYAFYRDNPSSVNIAGVGQLSAPCYGGHWCNRTDFIPVLSTSTTEILASPISLNNGVTGGDVTQTFTFNIENASILTNGVRVGLRCANGNNNCHTGVTWVVLTAEVNGITQLLFNSCVVPDELSELNIKCIDCCDWDGSGIIRFNLCNLRKEFPTQFTKIDNENNIWETNADLGCGDIFNMVIQCDKNINFDEPPPEVQAASGIVYQNVGPCESAQVVTITNNFSTSGRLEIFGGVDDEVLINGQIYQPGRYPFSWDYYGSPCGSNNSTNGAHEFSYVKILAPQESINVGVKDNGGGGGIDAEWVLTPLTICDYKWKVLSAELPCATNFRYSGILEPCDCDKPPFFGFLADNMSQCSCCNSDIGFTHNTLGEAPIGAQWSYVSFDYEPGSAPYNPYSYKVIAAGSNGCGYDASFNGEALSRIAQWINDGGIFLYQTEWYLDQYSGCGRPMTTNQVMEGIGCSLRSDGGAYAAFGTPYNAITSSSPLVNGINFIGSTTAKIYGGTQLVYAPANQFSDGAACMMVERIGDGCVILYGDFNLHDYTEQSRLSWKEFLSRLLTIPVNQIL